jgi:hypothetical protein
VPAFANTCCTVVALPDSVADWPSLKSTKIDVIEFPGVAVAVIVKVTTAPAAGFDGDALMVTVGRGAGVTVTDADAVDVSPNASNPVTTTR